MVGLQISDVRDVVGISGNEVTIIGILIGIVIILAYVVIHLDKKRHEALSKLIEAEKEHSKELLDVHKDRNESLNRLFNILEILKERVNGHSRK